MISRAQLTPSSEDTYKMAHIIAKIDVAESLQDLSIMSNTCLNRIFLKGIPTDLKETTNQLRKKMDINTDLITLKKELGNYMFQKKQYPF